MTCTIRATTRRIRMVLREVAKKVVKDGREQWKELENVLMRVLNQFPEAKAAVIVGIREVLGTNYDYEAIQPDGPGGVPADEIRV